MAGAYKYTWKVIKDPSGDFIGRLLRLTDIDPSRLCGYPIRTPYDDGTMFRNIETGEVIEIKNGKPVMRAG